MAAIASDAERRPTPTLLSAPITTLTEFAFVVRDWLYQLLAYLLSHRIAMTGLGSAFICYSIMKLFGGPGIQHVEDCFQQAIWWMTLGILSSIGLGTGLHTFVMYLGPYIAKVTIAAEECRSFDFARAGPQAFVCRHVPSSSSATPTILEILHQVQFACFLWGLGTALGELPPYFMARAAARSGRAGATPISPTSAARDDTLLEYMKRRLLSLFQRFGFAAILIFASVPNPLFDLAGVTCGHFGVPFWTFFGATAIGKAVFKVGLQALTVIYMFHEGHLESLLLIMRHVFPKMLCDFIEKFFSDSKTQFHRLDAGAKVGGSRNLVAILWQLFLVIMFLSFVRSIIDASVSERIESRAAEKKQQ